MTFTLGMDPLDMTVSLNLDADFVHTLQRQDETPWPDGSELRLVLKMPATADDITWAATLAGDIAAWHVDKAEVNAAIALKPKRAELRYVEGDLDLWWAAAKKVTINR